MEEGKDPGHGRDDASFPCPACGEPLPPAVLVLPGAGEAEPSSAPRTIPLSLEDAVLGRSSTCEIPLPDAPRTVSRRHARIRWTGERHEIVDEGSTHGTFVDGRRLAPGEGVPLRDGARLRLGELVLHYRRVAAPPPGEGAPGEWEEILGLLGRINSLDPRVAVARALELLRAVSGVDRALLVGLGKDPFLDPLLVTLDDPRLRVSRSTIEEAVREGTVVARLVDPEAGGEAPSESILSLNLRRIWVAPVRDGEGQVFAVVYLDSTELPSGVLDPARERTMRMLVEQIGLALRNAALHARLVDLNAHLEEKVAERTRALEESRAALVAQDRLVTLGRLVAAIAHELNNPAGALASFSETLRGGLDGVLRVREELATVLPGGPELREEGLALLAEAIRAAASGPLDTRARRAREEELAQRLRERGVPGAENLARRYARAGLGVPQVEARLRAVAAGGEGLAALLERVHRFARGIETIGFAARQVASIVARLKTYAHLDQAEVETADVHRGIEAALEVLRSRIPPGIEVETRFAEIEPFPHRPGELAQVWTNLVDNAVRAMGESGTLTIETLDRDDHVEVRVADTGPGIPPELGERIFELHTTTRGPGAGLGLGLPICRVIVEQHHGGTLSFESRPGRTVFVARLPKRPPGEGREEMR